MVIVAEPTLRPVQALVRWDPAGHAVRELGERRELAFPPVFRMAAVAGPVGTVAEFLAGVELPGDAEVLGPVPVAAPGGAAPSAESERALVRVPPGSGAGLAAALKMAQAARMARGAGPEVRIRIDPPDIG